MKNFVCVTDKTVLLIHPPTSLFVPLLHVLYSSKAPETRGTGETNPSWRQDDKDPVRQKPPTLTPTLMEVPNLNLVYLGLLYLIILYNVW